MFLGLLDPDPDPLVRGMDPEPHPDQDPSVRGMDPRIRIHAKMSWIRNTVYMQKIFSNLKLSAGGEDWRCVRGLVLQVCCAGGLLGLHKQLHGGYGGRQD